MGGFPKRLFIAGTDTAVGKTLVAAMLVAGLNGYYWKPVQSGSDEGTDTAWIMEKTGLPADRFIHEAYRLKGYMSPHAAAILENIRIDHSNIRIPDMDSSRHLVMEGAGGLMVPLNDRWLMIDLIEHLAAPVLLVARSTLGTINHTLMSIDCLRKKGITVIGVVMNGPKNESNQKAIEHFGKVRVLAQVEPMEEVNNKTLTDAFVKCFAVIP